MHSARHVRAFLAAVALAATSLLASTPALAMPLEAGTYRLLDHGDGLLGPNYGLRLDEIDELFSVELGGAEALLTWDGANSASITGTLFSNGSGELWSVEYTLMGVVPAGTGFVASGATGSLQDPMNNVIALTGLTNGDGDAFLFQADGHRLNDDFTPTARGWLEPQGMINDWLVRAEIFDGPPVPEPGTALLLGLGLAGFARRRR